jgi:hypothetical protein
VSTTGKYELAPVVDGVLLSRTGEVHRLAVGKTWCDRRLPERYAPVSAVQAQVHKLPICHACFPFVNPIGRKRAQ